MLNIYSQFEVWNSVQTAQHEALLKELAVLQALRSSPRNGAAHNVFARVIQAVRNQVHLSANTSSTPARSAQA